ncbi:MAG TPA: hypothetical protein PKN04_16020 [bacterium]|nr:hypothetical protein [bacterium]HPG47244.1 hypothetical protein [bacterium]HPM99716.1 hypothetical protein [bacterium]
MIEYPPIQFYKFSEKPFQAGVEEHKIDGVTVKVFSAEKTLVDCFKFRNKIGMDVVLAALKLYKIRMKFDHKTILEYAKICRVDRIVRPYLEAIGFDNQWRDHFIQGQELLLSRFANSQEQSAKAQH